MSFHICQFNHSPIHYNAYADIPTTDTHFETAMSTHSTVLICSK